MDRTARLLLDLGRTTRTTRPYEKFTKLGVETIVVDTELLERFVDYCATIESGTLTDTEMHLFMVKFSTETNTGIGEVERAQVFEQLSDEILKLIEEVETTDKVITEEYRANSTTILEKDGIC